MVLVCDGVLVVGVDVRYSRWVSVLRIGVDTLESGNKS